MFASLPDEILRLLASFWPSVLTICRDTRRAVLDSMGPVRPMTSRVHILESPCRQDICYILARNECFVMEEETDTMPLILHRARKVRCHCNRLFMDSCECTWEKDGVHGSIMRTERFPFAFFPATNYYVDQVFRCAGDDASNDVYVLLCARSLKSRGGVHYYKTPFRSTRTRQILHEKSWYNEHRILLVTNHTIITCPDDLVCSIPCKNQDEACNIWWFGGMLCVKSYNERKEHVIRMWDVKTRTFCRAPIVGKRKWSRFRLKHRVQRPARYTGKIPAVAPDGVRRFLVRAAGARTKWVDARRFQHVMLWTN